MSNVAEITDATFADEVLTSSVPVVVDYWADWCSPCKQLSPILDELSLSFGDRVRFVKIDTNANPATTAAQGVMSLPTIQIFRDGEVVKAFQGAKPKSVLTRAIEDVLA